MSKKNNYTDDMPSLMLEKMKKGALPCEVAGVLGVRKEDIITWLRDTRKVDFRDSFKLGMAASEGYWARMGLEALTGGLGKTFKERLYMYVLESQFGWCKGGNTVDKVEKEEILSDEDLDAKIEELIGATTNIIPLSEKTKNIKKKVA